MFYSKLVYTVASIDTRCIDSNLESERYISRVGRASKFLSLYGTYAGTYGILIPCSTGPPHRDDHGTRQQDRDQVGWSEGGPHIVNQLTFVISARERLQTHEN